MKLDLLRKCLTTMRFYGKTEYLIVLGIIIAVGFGCKYSEIKEKFQTSESPKTSKGTVITKANISQRLTTRLVRTADKLKPGKPNPLTLQLAFSNSNKDFLLNREYFENFGALANTLKQIVRDREQNGVFAEGTNDVYWLITLPMYQKTIDEYNSKNIFVEDFEKLVDVLRKEGLVELEFDVNEENQVPGANELKINKPTFASPGDSAKDRLSVKEMPKSISGGVLNGKAVNPEKPVYPAAARAVRASGAVNVQVTVDENGDVISADAVSGHPLLRSSAVTAARSTKFKPTLLSGQAVQVTGVIIYNFKPE